MKNNFFEQSGENEDKVGEILRAGFKLPTTLPAEQNFTNQVMSRIATLDSSFVFPGFLWAVPAVLVVMILATMTLGLRHEEKTVAAGVDEVLLAGMPTETQNILGHSPSMSVLEWNPIQGGLLP